MDTQAKQRLAQLWREVFGEAPCLDADPDVLARILVRSLPPAPPYELKPLNTVKRSRPRRSRVVPPG